MAILPPSYPNQNLLDGYDHIIVPSGRIVRVFVNGTRPPFNRALVVTHKNSTFAVYDDIKQCPAQEWIRPDLTDDCVNKNGYYIRFILPAGTAMPDNIDVSHYIDPKQKIRSFRNECISYMDVSIRDVWGQVGNLKQLIIT